ncbi:MAG: 16S rRNA (cytosine(967)-C(5))-methyltransferase RsmB, partial [Clostridiales bacterium]|nr:16S rRNA (cytosine(967)-C(5))-methyltransferase RsmB [Clostridiales bacterium]
MEEKITVSPARTAALEVLIACEKRRAWSDSELSASIRRAGLSGRDAALTRRMCYGVQQNQLLLLYWLEQLCRVPVERLELPIRLILELGLYQLAFLDRVPAHAAVDESVKLARTRSKNPRSPGLVNGVLRSFLRQKNTIPAPESLSVRYSHPQWLVDLLRNEVPEDTLEALLQADNSQPATVIQVNTLKTDGAALVRRREGEGVTVEAHPFLPGCYQLSETGDLSHLPSFREGLFQVQDAAARLAVLAAGPRPGMSVLDACAAPGGKSFQTAMEMKNRGSILSCDLQPKKLTRIREGAERLGIDCITTRAMDGRM